MMQEFPRVHFSSIGQTSHIENISTTYSKFISNGICRGDIILCKMRVPPIPSRVKFPQQPTAWGTLVVHYLAFHTRPSKIQWPPVRGLCQ